MFITQTESLERCKQINWAAKKKRARSREWCHCVMFGFRDGNKEFEFEFRARIRDRDRGKYAQSGVSNLFLSFSPINPSRRHTLTSIWGWYGSVINPVKDLIFFMDLCLIYFVFIFTFRDPLGKAFAYQLSGDVSFNSRRGKILKSLKSVTINNKEHKEAKQQKHCLYGQLRSECQR